MASNLSCGLTPALSNSLPTEDEKRRSDTLVGELRRQKTFESPSDTEKRYKVLESLQRICDEFVKTVAREKDAKNDVLIRNAHGKVFTYGSFRLGVFGPGSDIDTLIVAPKYVTRDDYFEHFPKLLVAMAPAGAITDMTVVTDTFVPIIKFEYSGISIDLIFSRIFQMEISSDFDSLKNSNLLRGLDEYELRSLNGTRVTDEILQLVPEQSTFKMALRAIKLWAQRRAIYGNILGFPGGVAWAMMVARVCQLYPRATASVVVNKFFMVMGKWQWPQPVLLKAIETGPLPVRVWSPKNNRGDSFHLMPVITPAYPSMCATFNISRSSMTVINRELKQGLRLTEDIMNGKRPWADLFVKHTFFTSNYKHYISVTTAGKTEEAHKIWSGYVESKVRTLVQRLEHHPSIALAHAFNKGYDRRHRCKDDAEVAQVQEGSLEFLVKNDANNTAPGPKDQKDGLKIKAELSNGSSKADPGHEVKAEAGLEVKAELGLEVRAEPGHEVKAEPGHEVKAEPGHEVKAEPGHEDIKSVINPEAKANGNARDLDDASAQGDALGSKIQDGDQAAQSDPSFPVDVFTTTHYIGLVLIEGKNISLDLSYQVDDFKSFCRMWQKYKDGLESLVSIGVHYVRNTNLPDDVFDANEKKPRKRPAGAKGASGGQKRGPSEDQPPPAKRKQASIAAAG